MPGWDFRAWWGLGTGNAGLGSQLQPLWVPNCSLISPEAPPRQEFLPYSCSSFLEKLWFIQYYFNIILNHILFFAFFFFPLTFSAEEGEVSCWLHGIIYALSRNTFKTWHKAHAAASKGTQACLFPVHSFLVLSRYQEEICSHPCCIFWQGYCQLIIFWLKAKNEGHLHLAILLFACLAYVVGNDLQGVNSRQPG